MRQHTQCSIIFTFGPFCSWRINSSAGADRFTDLMCANVTVHHVTVARTSTETVRLSFVSLLCRPIHASRYKFDLGGGPKNGTFWFIIKSSSKYTVIAYPVNQCRWNYYFLLKIKTVSATLTGMNLHLYCRTAVGLHNGSVKRTFAEPSVRTLSGSMWPAQSEEGQSFVFRQLCSTFDTLASQTES